MTIPDPGLGNGRQTAFNTAHNAFANGWIDLEDLQARVARLEPVQALAPEKDPSKKTGADTGTAFWTMGGVLALNILIWAIISVTSGEDIYFWPVWLLIPTSITAVPYIAAMVKGK